MSRWSALRISDCRIVTKDITSELEKYCVGCTESVSVHVLRVAGARGSKRAEGRSARADSRSAHATRATNAAADGACATLTINAGSLRGRVRTCRPIASHLIPPRWPIARRVVHAHRHEEEQRATHSRAARASIQCAVCIGSGCEYSVISSDDVRPAHLLAAAVAVRGRGGPHRRW
jgi:hypothetical protein